MRILAILAEEHGARACLAGALAASAGNPAASIEALHVKVDPDRLFGVGPDEVALQRLREPREGTAEHRAEKVRLEFEAWLEGLSGDDQRRITWKEVTGAEERNVVEASRTADLLVLSRPHNLDAHDAMHAAIFQAHRPLLVPPDWAPAGRYQLASRVAIGWRPTAQARRAMAQSEPWLRHASKVFLIEVMEHGRYASTDEAEQILLRLGLKPELVQVFSDQKEPGLALLQAVEDMEADTLVMGAYRHSEIVEWALGGTTRYVMAHAHVPLLLAH